MKAVARRAFALSLATVAIPATAQTAPGYSGPDPVVSPSPDGLPEIPSNFDRAKFIERDPSPQNPASDGVIGAFRFICQAGQLNYDDPIVYPGQPGASPHLHQWFGNANGNALSTFRTLRSAGESSCMGPLNRSAYWMPAMLDGHGHVVRPDWISIYYKREPSRAKDCGKDGAKCRRVPRGLRYVFGYDTRRMGQRQPENVIFHWKCITPQNTQRGDLQPRFDMLDCRTGDLLMVTLASPDCWDGKRLDSPGHRDHVVQQVPDPSDGKTHCPASHPFLIPQFTVGATYMVAPGERIRDWYLSSDRMAGMPVMPSGSTFHADWYGAWDDPTLQTWTTHCIDRTLSCSAGALGDGTIMRRRAGYGLTAYPHLVPIPLRP